MKKSLSIKSQRGDFLVEAVIGLFLVSVMVQGMMFITSRTSAVQTGLRLQEFAVQQMRAVLMQNHSGLIDICSVAPSVILPNKVSIPVDVQGCDATTTALVNGIVIPDVPKPIALSITSELVGGQLVVGGTWSET